SRNRFAVVSDGRALDISAFSTLSLSVCDIPEFGKKALSSGLDRYSSTNCLSSCFTRSTWLCSVATSASASAYRRAMAIELICSPLPARGHTQPVSCDRLQASYSGECPLRQGQPIALPHRTGALRGQLSWRLRSRVSSTA